jgi:hypothetical protein
MSWDIRFPALIAVPRGKPLVKLRDAATYITALPAKTQHEPAWQNAVHVLLQAADHGGPMEFARLGMVQALYPKPAPVYHSIRKDPIWRNTRKLGMDRCRFPTRN